MTEHTAEIKPFPTSWIAISREIFDHPVVGAAAQPPKPADPKRYAWPPFMAWQWLLCEANFAARERFIAGDLLRVHRGQVAVSERYLANKANWGRKAVRVFLERLANLGMIRMAKPGDADQLNFFSDTPAKLNRAKKGPPLTVLTICNYDKYQSVQAPKGPARAQQGPSRGPNHNNGNKGTRERRG